MIGKRKALIEISFLLSLLLFQLDCYSQSAIVSSPFYSLFTLVARSFVDELRE